MIKKLFAILGALALLMGVSVAQATDTNSAALSATTMVTAVTDPVFEFDAKLQAVRMQLPEMATILALAFVPDRGRECGDLASDVSTTPFAGTCITFTGLNAGKGSCLVSNISAKGGWAKSVSIWVLLADGTTWSEQVSLPVIAPLPPAPTKTTITVMTLINGKLVPVEVPDF